MVQTSTLPFVVSSSSCVRQCVFYAFTPHWCRGSSV